MNIYVCLGKGSFDYIQFCFTDCSKSSGQAATETPTYKYSNTEEFCEGYGYVFYHSIPNKEIYFCIMSNLQGRG